MKIRGIKSLFSLPVLVLILYIITGCKDKPGILLVTGGHDFDTVEFFNLFFSNKGLSVDTVSQPSANLVIENIKPDRYDAIVFYDMWQEIDQPQKNAYIRLLENGTGIIFLHHSLVSYQDWDEITRIRGGKYRERGYGSDSMDLSGYEHGLDLHVKVIDPDHPVIKGIKDFEIRDEGYNNVEILPSVTPLLAVTHPLCAPYVAWANEYKQSRIVYIMLGHDQIAYKNPSFRQLLYNSISWVSNGK